MPGQIEPSGEKGLGQGGDQEPDGYSDRASELVCGDGRTFSAALHQSGLYGSVASRKPLPSKKYMPARLELEDSQTMTNKILWSDEAKIGLNAKRHVTSLW